MSCRPRESRTGRFYSGLAYHGSTMRNKLWSYVEPELLVTGRKLHMLLYKNGLVSSGLTTCSTANKTEQRLENNTFSTRNARENGSIFCLSLMSRYRSLPLCLAKQIRLRNNKERETKNSKKESKWKRLHSFTESVVRLENKQKSHFATSLTTPASKNRETFLSPKVHPKCEGNCLTRLRKRLWANTKGAPYRAAKHTERRDAEGRLSLSTPQHESKPRRDRAKFRAVEEQAASRLT